MSFEFWKGIFEDDTKSTGANSAQFFSFMALVACIGWGTYFMIVHKTIPDGTTLTSMGGFSTIHYLVHRGASAVKPTGS
jgi:hypothetical protein